MNISLLISTTSALIIYLLMGYFCIVKVNQKNTFQPNLINQPFLVQLVIILVNPYLFKWKDIFIFALYLIFIIPMNMKPCKESLLYLIDPESGRDSDRIHFLLTASIVLELLSIYIFSVWTFCHFDFIIWTSY